MKICLPINESLISLCTKNLNDLCDYRAKKVEEFYESHKDYVNNIKKQYFYYFNEKNEVVKNDNSGNSNINSFVPNVQNLNTNFSNSSQFNYPVFKQINFNERMNSVNIPKNNSNFLPSINTLDILNKNNEEQQNLNFKNNFGNFLGIQGTLNNINNNINQVNPNLNQGQNFSIPLNYDINQQNQQNTLNNFSLLNSVKPSNSINVPLQNEIELYNKMTKEELINIILNLKKK